MRASSRRVHAAGMMSVALVAVARAARPSRRVTCVRVPQAPLASAQLAPAPPTPAPHPRAPAPTPTPIPIPTPTAELAGPPTEARTAADLDAGQVLTGADWSVPTFPFEDVALWQPAEVLPAVATEPGPDPETEAVPETAEAIATAAPEAIATAEPAPEPSATAEAKPEPSATAAPAPTAAPERPPAPDPAPRTAPPHEHLDPWGWAEPWVFEIPSPSATGQRGNARTRKRGRGYPRRRGGSGRRGHPMIALAVIVLAVVVSVWIAVPRSPSASAQPKETADVSYSPHPSAYAVRTIPAGYLHDYWHAANEYGLDWTKLAAVGQIESDQGRSATPGVVEGTNPAGAAGPAQFLGSTWARYGVDADGRGTISPYDPADAITAMAAYLKASGAPENWNVALYTYNHSSAYVDAVIALSRRYLGS